VICLADGVVHVVPNGALWAGSIDSVVLPGGAVLGGGRRGYDGAVTAQGDLDRARIGALLAGELDRFGRDRPRSQAMLERARAHMPNGVPMAWMVTDNGPPVYIDRGAGAGFTDLDGFRYLDFNASDMAMFCGHANPAIVAAVQAQVARSTQFLLPTEDSVAVAEELARRYPVGYWQFTLSATQANTEAIRLARAVTGREVLVLFQGHYHGHFEEGLVDLAGGQARMLQRGLSKGVTGRVRIAQFNDPGLLHSALKPGDVALVLTEPAMTNNLHLLYPEPGWHDALRALTREHGTLLSLDETHTHVVGPGGATGQWQLRPDMITIGKAVAGGVPMGAYGVTAELADELDAARNMATGGTLFGNALSAAAAHAALTEILTAAAYAHTAALGAELADGIEQAISAADMPWTPIRFGPRSGQWYGPIPRTGAQAHALTDPELTRLIRIWLANRGIWEALPGAGPTVPVPATRADVARYTEAYAELLTTLTA
jgi:glutamate-1-semialdehyde 2,1-aminomutase